MTTGGYRYDNSALNSPGPHCHRDMLLLPRPSKVRLRKETSEPGTEGRGGGLYTWPSIYIYGLHMDLTNPIYGILERQLSEMCT